MLALNALKRPAWHALLYFVTASFCVALTRFAGGFAALWISTAILVPALLQMSGREYKLTVAACCLASFLATGLFGFGWGAAPFLVVANLGEAVIDTWAIKKISRTVPGPMSVRWVGAVYGAGGLIVPALTGLLSAGFVKLTFGSDFSHAWAGWTSAHALGFLTVYPLAMLLAQSRRKSTPIVVKRSKRTDALLIMAMALLAGVCFGQAVAPLLFLPPMLLMFAALSSDTLIAAIMLAILMVIGGGLTMAGYGPLRLVDGEYASHMRFFQFYIVCVALTGAPITILLDRRRRLFNKLTDSEARYRMLSDFSTDIITISDLDGKLRFVSPSVEQIGNFKPAELVGQLAHRWISKDFWPQISTAHVSVTAQPGSTARVEFLGLIAGGRLRWFETHMRAIVRVDGVVDGVCSVIRDISQRKQIEVELAEAALTDPLTGLGNRRAFEAYLVQAAGRGDEGCIAMLDIDLFKLVNDRHGHAGGDEVLRAFARVARGALREGDFLARMGGEEFAIYLPETSLAQAELICQRLRHALANHRTPIGKALVRITVSIGLVRLSANMVNTFERADVALYRAKSEGRNRLAIAA